MKKTILLLALATSISLISYSQDYLTRNGKISFFSHTDVEDIKAENNEAVSTIDSKTGAIEFKVAIKSFIFPKASMQQHFNDVRYMESDKYPKSEFSGKISNLKAVNFKKDGSYKVTVEGKMTIKETTKDVKTDGQIIIANGVVTAKATFNLNRKDYNVIGPSMVQHKIADVLELTVDCVYEKL